MGLFNVFNDSQISCMAELTAVICFFCFFLLFHYHHVDFVSGIPVWLVLQNFTCLPISMNHSLSAVASVHICILIPALSLYLHF